MKKVAGFAIIYLIGTQAPDLAFVLFGAWLCWVASGIPAPKTLPPEGNGDQQ